MTLEQDHGISAGFVWKDEYYRHLQYIATNDPDDDYYRPSSSTSHTLDTETSTSARFSDAAATAATETGEAPAGPINPQAQRSEASGIDWLELKDAIKYQLQQILFDIEDSGTSSSGTGASEQPQPNAYGWKGEQQGGLAVERGTKARGKGFPIKAIPTLHPAASRLAMNRIFFPPYPLQLIQGAGLHNLADAESDAKRTTENEDASSTTAAEMEASAGPEDAYITSLHSDGVSESSSSVQGGAGAVTTTNGASSESGPSSASVANGSNSGVLRFSSSSSSDEEDRNGDGPSAARGGTEAASAERMDTGGEGGAPQNAAGASNETDSAAATTEWQLVRPGDLQSFFPAKVVPPPEGFGSWGKRYTDENEIQRDYRVLCAMLDEFDDAGYMHVAAQPQEQQTKAAEGAGADAAAATANGNGNRTQNETKLVPCASPPFTIQRLCELVLEPRRHYSALPKYVAALKRTLAVTAGKFKFPTLIDIEDEDEEEEQPLQEREMDVVPGSQPQDSIMVDVGPQPSTVINGTLHAAAATTRATGAAASGSSVTPIVSRTSSRAGTPSSASTSSSRSRSRSRAASHEIPPLWTPIPFLMRREAEERERLATAQLVPIPLADARAGSTSLSSSSSTGQQEATMHDGSSENDALSGAHGSGGSGGVQSMELDESSGAVESNLQSSLSSSAAEEDGPREIPAGSALGLTEAPAAATAPIPQPTIISPGTPPEATSPSGSGNGATKPPNAIQPLGVPDGLVDELDDAHWRGKSKTGLPGLDAEVHPISSTTTSSSHATASSINRAAAAGAVAGANASGNADSQAASSLADAGSPTPAEQAAQAEERQIKKLKSSE